MINQFTLTHHDLVNIEARQQWRDLDKSYDLYGSTVVQEDGYRYKFPVNQRELKWIALNEKRTLQRVGQLPADHNKTVAYYTARYDYSPYLFQGLFSCIYALVWTQHGYHAQCVIPGWVKEAYWKAELAALIVKPADYRQECQQLRRDLWSYRFYDAANTWVAPWAIRAQYSDEKRLRAHVASEYTKHRGYHLDYIEALIDYQSTGIAKLPAGTLDQHLKYTDPRTGKPALYPRIERETVNAQTGALKGKNHD